MPASKEAELTTAVLLYVMRCLDEGDQQALRVMNFGPEEIEALGDMNLADLQGADALRIHCLRLRLDRSVFWPMLDHLQSRQASRTVMRELIAADAPLPMMQQLFSMSSREYTRWRRLLLLGPSAGRPAEPSEADTHTLWQAWQEHGQAGEKKSLAGADYLALHQKTSIGLRTLWTLVRHWEEYGGEAPERAAGHGA